MSNDDTEHEAVVLFKPNVRTMTTREEAQEINYEYYPDNLDRADVSILATDYIALLDEVERLRWWKERYYLALDDIAADDMDSGDMSYTARQALEYNDSFDDDAAPDTEQETT